MRAAVRIKAGKYGRAIGLLLERGGVFQTRHERTLLVNSDQKKAALPFLGAGLGESEAGA